jgi:hypothetical protein
LNEARELYLAHKNRRLGAKAHREAMHAGGVPILGSFTDDIHALHQRLTQVMT